MKKEIKKLKGKRVKLEYKVNGYNHVQHGKILHISTFDFIFEPFEFKPIVLSYSQVIKIEEINKP